MKKKYAFLILLTSLLTSSPALAHNFFVSITESMAHPPGSIVTNIGWGHGLPMHDFFQGNTLQSYSVYDPSLKKIDFPFDPDTNEGVEGNSGQAYPDFPGGKILAGDAFCRKLFFNSDAPQGTYQVAATTKKIQFAIWTNQKGREKWGRRYLDEIKDPKEIKLCWNFQSFAKSFVSVGQWSEPKPLGHLRPAGNDFWRYRQNPGNRPWPLAGGGQCPQACNRRQWAQRTHRQGAGNRIQCLGNLFCAPLDAP